MTRRDTVLRDGNPILARMYCKIILKCKKVNEGCTWTGGIEDMSQHLRSCQHNMGAWVERATVAEERATVAEKRATVAEKRATVAEDRVKQLQKQ